MLHGEDRYTSKSACDQSVQSPAGATGGAGRRSVSNLILKVMEEYLERQEETENSGI